MNPETHQNETQENSTAPEISVFAEAMNGFCVRVINQDGESWFVAKDVCEILEIKQTARAVENLDDDEKGVSIVHTLGGKQAVTIINESGLYALIFRSRKPQAQVFRKWVTSEVLPAIRATGSYSAIPQQNTQQQNATLEHPVTLFLNTIDQMALRGVSASKAAYSVGCLFQSSLAHAISSNRPMAPLVFPPPPENQPASIESRSGQSGPVSRWGRKTQFQKTHDAQDIIELLRDNQPLAVSPLQRLSCDELGMCKATFYRLWAEIKGNEMVSRSEDGTYTVA